MPDRDDARARRSHRRLAPAHGGAAVPGWQRRLAAWPAGAHLAVILLMSLVLWGLIGVGAHALLADPG